MEFQNDNAAALVSGSHLLVGGCPGLRLIASESRKTWTYRYKSPSSGLMKQIKIGGWPNMSVDAAIAEWVRLRDERNSGDSPSSRDRWTREKVAELVKGFRNRSQFVRLAPGAYYHAKKNGYLEEVCSYFGAYANGFDKTKPGRLYAQVCVVTDEGLASGLWMKPGVTKIGITNETADSRALSYSVLTGYATKPTIQIWFSDGELCAQIELAIKRKYRNYRFKKGFDGRDDFLSNGMTEVHSFDVLSDFLKSDDGRAMLSMHGVHVEILDGKERALL